MSSVSLWPIATALCLTACKPEAIVGLDLTERLGPDEVRAGVVTDPSALFGGVSAEGEPGDVLIYNDRVRFVVQAPRPGSYYIHQGGGVIDADIVRPEGQPGRDGVDEWTGMYGLGRLMDATSVAVVDPGVISGRARVVAFGPESQMELISGALGSTELIPDDGLQIRVEYALEPGSWFLQVRSTITAAGEDADGIVPGDIVMGSLETMAAWEPGVGLQAPSSGEKPWTAYVGRHNDVAVMLSAGAGESYESSQFSLIGELADLLVGFGEKRDIPAGESIVFERLYGVGPDLARLTDELLRREGVATEPVSGEVQASDGPVAGARVNVLVGGEPYTLAFTGDDGSYEALVPAGSEVSVLAVGSGPRLFTDLPPGATSYSPYSADVVTSRVLDSLRDGAVPVPFAEGRGFGTPEDPTRLGVPGKVVVRASDGLPFEVRAFRTSAGEAGDPRLVPDGPGGGATAIGWGRDGDVELLLEPGEYRLVAHRGIRFERDEALLTIAAGGEQTFDVELPKAYEHPGYVLADPHSHASPSSDGEVTMEDRLVVMAGLGVQLHFGTDHDHIATYGALLEPLGLADVLQTVPSVEMSPVLRGHLNLYPLVPDETLPNNGAWPWWAEPVETTDAQMQRLRERFGDIGIQLNHPLDTSGLAELAGWSSGQIANGDKWSEDFESIEVDNGGHNDDYVQLYLDLVARGVLVAPMGSSDSHSHTGGGVGFNTTFIGIGSDDPADYTPEALREAIRARRTIASRGPFLDLSVDPGSVVVGSTMLQVEALSPSWMTVDALVLLRDGVEVERIAGTSATFALSPDADASYVVLAEGSTAWPTVASTTPWALSSAILVDLAGDGWEPPLPPLEIGD